MNIKNLKFENKGLMGPFHLNKRFIATGIIVAGLAAGIGAGSRSLNENVSRPYIPSTSNAYLYSKSYHEEHPEKYPTLKIKIDHPEVIQSEKVKILIITENNLLIQYVKAFPDGYINVEETYIYPGDTYYIQVNCDEEYSVTHFSVHNEVEDNSEIEFSYDCETKTAQISSPDNIIEEIKEHENTK